ncbi:MAG: sulfotransferase [Fuerstiella sp.]
MNPVDRLPNTEDAPIFVTGMPRSGTTFIQHLLSQHPRIQIHGQEPADCAWADWLNLLLDGVGFAASSNEQLGYDSQHYAAPNDGHEVAERFLPFMKWYLTGGQHSPRWGAKSLTQCRIASEAIQHVWPAARWIVCIRDPFRCLESLRNTFDREQEVESEEAIEWWTSAVRFAHEDSGAMPVLFDRLRTPAQRRQQTAEIFAFIDESVTPEVSDFVEEWPTVHKVVSEDERSYRISQDDREQMLGLDTEFRSWVERLGYLDQEATLV